MGRIFAVVLFTLLALTAGSAFAQIAYVHEMTGSVTATAGSAPARNLKTGDTLETGTTVTTGEKSSAVIKFEDGQVMALSERSSFRISEYRYNRQRVRESSSVFELLAGGLRFITGVIGASRPDNVRLNVGTTTIGIRGTDGSLHFDPVTRAVTAAVLAGEVALVTPSGTQNVRVGEFSSHLPGQAPTPAAPIARAEAAVQSVLNRLAAQGVPINTPVVVQASARAAAAAAEARALAAQAAAQPNNPSLQQAARQANEQAQQALSTAVQEAQQAYQSAIQNGATPPAPPAAPPAPPNLPSPGATGPSTNTSPTPSGSSGAGAGGAGGGGPSAVPGTTSASPN